MGTFTLSRLAELTHLRCAISVASYKPASVRLECVNPAGITSIFKRHRSTAKNRSRSKEKLRPRKNLTVKASSNPRQFPHGRSQETNDPHDQSTCIPASQVFLFFEADVQRWSEQRHLQNRLLSFGIPEDGVLPLLRTFVEAVQSGHLSTPEAYDKYHLTRFTQDMSEDGFHHNIDVIYSTVFFSWASELSPTAAREAGISPKTLDYILSLTSAANRLHPPNEFPLARSMHRKVIMHVGPTNSGKTHNALRALAAAPTGIYAGPLRLLAHEIWERLNLGQIVPAGIEDAAELKVTPLQADLDSVLDVVKATPAPRKTVNLKYARACNMITGEEQKIVDPSAGLVSCTVEMISLTQLYDVAVIDEIQMIGDPERGGGWTSAVLGLRAKELHLCGEESAVPLIQALLKPTSDELVINRYQRLTPLRAEQESINGDLQRIRKGDCIVVFSRSNIFALKQRIESQTSMRCAVVYGRLPPEVRSEQAALFNDPHSGYDVIIGSDAIGMGLNLKIKRIIFDSVQKFDAGRERFLSVSQTKQIAGRAGRYGLHGDDSGGTTTTMIDSHLSFLRKTLNITVSPLPFARISPSKETFRTLANILPRDAPTMAVFDAHTFISMLPPTYRYTTLLSRDFRPKCDFVDAQGADLTIDDRLLFTLVPMSWRDSLALEMTGKMLRMHSDNMEVDLMTVLGSTSVMSTLAQVELKMNMKNPKFRPKVNVDELLILESLHKTLVLYVWMTFRQPLVYHQYAEAAALKERSEKALDWALQSLTRDRPSRPAHEKNHGIAYMSRAEAGKVLDLSKLWRPVERQQTARATS